ncbi:serine/threonine-protein kinase [Streptomyces sp. NPDC012794]|uniref:serine/threonine-protein kinase n=1 Tax=Streptomyces sp. NPDC012794 TaxID=3364850 RepID=UPI0036896588
MSQDEPRNHVVIAGRYRLGKRLGRGGMGTVWQASDELLGRAVAVKELHVGEGKEAVGALREARTVAQIKHPHVVVVHDVVEDGGRPYIVMELVEGGSLADRLGSAGPLGAGETARIGLALLGALSAAHDRGVLHRDVKPANVLMEAGTGRVVLTDFGIARLAGSTTISETGAFVGSPEYTSPERMQGAAAGPASDLWSLGALLCAALTGESPFHRDSLGGVLHAVVYDEIRPPVQAGPLTPLIRGLLERDPERRLGVTDAQRLLSAYVTTGSLPLLDRAPGPGRPAGPAAPAVPPAPPGYSPTERVTARTGPVPEPGPRAAGLRAGLVAALVVVAVIGAVAVTTLISERTGDEGRAGAQGGPASPAPGATAPSVPRPPTGQGPTPATATATVTAPAPVAPARTASGKPAPAGYGFVSDPEGFGLAVPQGFQRTTDDQRVFYVSADGAIRIGIKVKPASAGPLAAMRQSDANGPSNNPGYRDNSIVPTTHNGLPAALWEFTWNGFTAAEGPRHTFDLCWDENGRMYDVWVSAPLGRLTQARGHFDAALDSFVPVG